MKPRPVMTTASGIRIEYLSPETCEILDEDIAVAAENICRYNGARDVRLLDHFALVTLLAQSQRIGTMCWSPRVVGLVALHDFHETVVGDVVSGLKLLLPEFKRIERLWEERFHAHFGYEMPDDDEAKLVGHIDLRALVVETHATRHPVASLTAELHGGVPTEEEWDVWHRVRSMSSALKWALTTEAVRAGSRPR